MREALDSHSRVPALGRKGGAPMSTADTCFFSRLPPNDALIENFPKKWSWDVTERFPEALGVGL